MTTIRRSIRPALPLLILAGCSSATQGPAKVQSPAIVIDWAMGGQRLTPLSTAHHRLVLLSPVGDAPPAKAGPEQCVDAIEMLPGPPGDPRIYFLAGGQVQAWQAPLAAPAPLEGNDAKLNVTRLLAFARDATPEQMLVAAKPAGEAAEKLYTLTLGPGGITARAPVTLEVSGVKAFFERFSAPRCLAGGTRCVSASQADLEAFIDVRETPEGAPVTLRKLGKNRVADVRWTPDGKSLLALVACQ